MKDRSDRSVTTLDDKHVRALRIRRRRLRSLIDLECLELRTLAAQLRYIESTLADEAGDAHYGALTGLDGFRRRLDRTIHMLERSRGDDQTVARGVDALGAIEPRLHELLASELLGGLIEAYRARVVGLACAVREARELGAMQTADHFLGQLERLERDLSILSGTLAG